MFYFSTTFYCILQLIFIGHFNYSLQVDDTYLNDCLPQLADTCFNKLSKMMSCYGDAKCDDSETFCALLDDSLKCSADIIDGDCSKTNSTAKFDSWYKGLRSVYSYICLPVSTNGTQKSRLPDFSNSLCWNKKTFINCIGKMLNIHHVVDMLNTTFDNKECIRMIIAMTSCNMNSVSVACSGFQEALVNDLIFIFFSQHKCNDFEMEKNGMSSLLSSNYLLTLLFIVVFMYFK